MPHAILTQVAESDLDDILFYISFIVRKPETGERIYYEIRDRVREHVEKELPGHRHESAPEGWYYIHLKSMSE